VRYSAADVRRAPGRARAARPQLKPGPFGNWSRSRSESQPEARIQAGATGSAWRRGRNLARKPEWQSRSRRKPPGPLAVCTVTRTRRRTRSSESPVALGTALWHPRAHCNAPSPA
jgi:hypothetical protein